MMLVRRLEEKEVNNKIKTDQTSKPVVVVFN